MTENLKHLREIVEHNDLTSDTTRAEALAVLDLMEADWRGATDAMRASIMRRHEWGDANNGMCADTADYVVQPLRAIVHVPNPREKCHATSLPDCVDDHKENP